MILRSVTIGLFMMLTAPLCAEDSHTQTVQVDLRSPSYEDGEIKTTQGGVLKSNDVRIQAQHIHYIKKEVDGKTLWQLHAQGNLLVRYHGHNFVGDSLYYDFQSKEGYIVQGRTQIGSWFVGGEKIILESDGTYRLYKASLTTCETGKGLWEIRVKNGMVQERDIMTAKGATMRVLKVPIFWFPYLKARLSTLQSIPAHYRFITGGSQSQQAALRYLAYSSLALRSYLELGFWFKKGPYGMVDFDYNSPDFPLKFRADNFMAYDKQAKDSPSGAPPVSMFRQRYLGNLQAKVADKLQIKGQYERLSDDFVLETYFNRFYYLHVQKHTFLELKMHEKLWLSSLRAKVRINRFQTVDQELPTFFFAIKPIRLWNTPLIAEFKTNLGYYDYVFGSYVDNRFGNYQSSRLEIKPKLSLPFQIGGLALKGSAEYVGVGYGQTPRGRVVWNTLGVLHGDAHYSLSRVFNNKVRHTIEPYTNYLFMSKPTIAFDKHYFFNIDDAYAKINQLRFGFRNLFYTKSNDKISQPFSIDVYTYGFFNNTTIGTYIPRVYVEISKSLPFWHTSFTFIQNLQHHKIDCANVVTALTLSEDFAISFLFLHRSDYWYIKANFDNYLLDVFRQQRDLLASPLSDRRNVAQARVYWRVLRDVIFEFHSRHGWNRRRSPPFNEMRFDVTFLLPCNWRFIFSPQRTISPDSGAKYIWRWDFRLQLGGRPPTEMSKPYIFW